MFDGRCEDESQKFDQSPSQFEAKKKTSFIYWCVFLSIRCAANGVRVRFCVLVRCAYRQDNTTTRRTCCTRWFSFIPFYLHWIFCSFVRPHFAYVQTKKVETEDSMTLCAPEQHEFLWFFCYSFWFRDNITLIRDELYSEWISSNLLNAGQTKILQFFFLLSGIDNSEFQVTAATVGFARVEFFLILMGTETTKNPVGDTVFLLHFVLLSWPLVGLWHSEKLISLFFFCSLIFNGGSD